MEIKLGAYRYGFSFSFFLLLSLYVLLDRYGVGLACIGAVALHEMGHIFVMRLCGAQIDSMWFFPFGVRIEKRGLLSYERELLIYAGGPLANGLGLLIGKITWDAFALMNLLLLLFNLLPVGRLDGGVLLRLMLCRRWNPGIAAQIQRWIGGVLLVVLLVGALWMVRYGNLTLLATTAYLAVELMRE